MDNEEYKACPFCGKIASNLDEPINPDEYGVVCNICGAGGPMDDDGEVAILLWNTRPIEDKLRAELSEITAMRDALQVANRTYAVSVCPELDATIAELQAELTASKAENAKLRDALNLACMYAQDDEHDWSDIVRVTSNALLGIDPMEVE